jgi:hypothetical protein
MVASKTSGQKTMEEKVKGADIIGGCSEYKDTYLYTKKAPADACVFFLASGLEFLA